MSKSPTKEFDFGPERRDSGDSTASGASSKENNLSRPNSRIDRLSDELKSTPQASSRRRHYFLMICNALFVARHDESNLRRLLSEHGSEVANEVDDYGKTLLHYAVRADSTIDILTMILKFGIDINCKDVDGWNCLHLATRLNKSRDVAMAAFLIDHGIAINDKTVCVLSSLTSDRQLTL